MSDAQVIVVRAPSIDVDVACGNAPMIEVGTAAAQDSPSALASGDDGPLLGKRYADDETGLEVLCTRPGAGALTVDGRSLAVKGAKPLPSSD